MISSLLLMLAFVCFAFAAWRHCSPDWNRVIAVGFACWVLSLLLAGLR